MSSRPARTAVAVAAVILTGVVAFLVTANRTVIPLSTTRAPRPATTTGPSATPSLSLGDVARDVLGRTATIEALGARDEGLGTGWLFDAKGDFVTNAHVIQGQLAVRIRGRDGSSHVGDVVGMDAAADVAVVRSRDGFAGTPLTATPGSLGPLPEPVVVVASARATGHGDITIESATHVEPLVPVTGDTTTGQPPTTTEYHQMLVLDGQSIYPGNSGGPVLDRNGRVIGILTLASKSTPQAFAIQITSVLAELFSFAGK